MDYYYIQYFINNKPANCVSDKHPFEFIKFFEKLVGEWRLDTWKTITREEYELGKTTVGIG